MKKVVLTAVIALGAISFAKAQQGAGRPSPDKIAEMILTRFDADKNGSLSLEECKKAERAPLAENFAKLDTNKDKKLSKKELEKVMEIFAEQRKKKE